MTVTIDHRCCTRCGLCLEVCPQKCLLDDGHRVTQVAEECFLCGHCRAVCPVDAVTVDGLEEHVGLPDIAAGSVQDERSGTGERPGPGRCSSRELVELMKGRRSCRHYTDRPVKRELLEQLIHIGITAPSGTNSQGWRFTIFHNRQQVEELGERIGNFYRRLNRKASSLPARVLGTIWPQNPLHRYYQEYFQTVSQALEDWDRERIDYLFHGATAVILVHSMTSASCPLEDGMLATGQILLAAESMGLGSCLIGFGVEAMRRDRTIMDWCGIEEDETICSVIGLGYPAVRFRRFPGRRRPQIHWFEGTKSAVKKEKS